MNYLYGKIRNKKYKKGFTLIELIVVMAVIAVLVLLAAPRFLGKTKEADKTKHVANAKTLEDASERYFVDEQDWPRLTDDAYTSEEIESYSERVLDVTGEEITLDPKGNYYDIDYEALSKYVKVPDDSDKNNYVLRNPVGKIYYLEGLTESGVERVDYKTKQDNTQKSTSSGKVTNIQQYEDDNIDVVFSGLGDKAYDDDESTYHQGVGIISWTGNLEDREIEIVGEGAWASGWGSYSLDVEFLDAGNSALPPVNSNNTKTSVAVGTNKRSIKLVVPKGAKKMRFSGGRFTNSMKIYEIKIPDRNVRPSHYEINSTSTTSSIELSWTGVGRAIIHKNGKLLSNVNGNTFTDKPLYSDSVHSYEVIFIDEFGNGKRVSYEALTDTHIVSFRGLDPDAFDGDRTTYHCGVGTVTWTGDLEDREIEIIGEGAWGSGWGSYSLNVEFLNENNIAIPPSNSTNTKTSVAVGTNKRSIKLVVPKGAKKMRFSGGRFTNSMKIYNIEVLD